MNEQHQCPYRGELPKGAYGRGTEHFHQFTGGIEFRVDESGTVSVTEELLIKLLSEVGVQSAGVRGAAMNSFGSTTTERVGTNQ